MPTVSEKKKKLLCLRQILLSETDPEHTLTLQELLQKLENMGISAERKSIYDDIETLRSTGLKIGTRKRKTYQYFLEDRTFTLEELQLIAGSICVSPFLSSKQAEALRSRLETLCSAYQAEALRQKIFTVDKPVEKDVPAAVQLLCRAISENRKVCFTPWKWQLTSQGKPEYAAKSSSRPVAVSPWRLLVERGRCELLAFTEEGAVVRLPLEKLEGLALLPEERELFPEPPEAAKQEKKAEKLVLEFPLDQLAAVTERFGSDFTVEAAGKGRVRAALKAEAGPELFLWLFSHGPEIRLTAPKKLVEQFREKAKGLAKLYKS